MELLTNQLYCMQINQSNTQEIIGDPTSKLFKLRRPDIYSQIDRSKYTNEDFIKIDKLTYGSNFKLWWICNNNQCGCHVWQATINNRIGNSRGCPFCSGKNGQTCIHTSFMNNQQLNLEYAWDLNPNINPWEISHNSHKKIIWRCQKHKTCNNHVWESNVDNRTRGTNCPFCINQQVCPCNSFMNNPLLSLLQEEFDYTNIKNYNIDPWKYSSGSVEYLFWKCLFCLFSWSSRIDHRSNGSGCPRCASKRSESKGEERCRLYLESLQIQSYSQFKLNPIPNRRYDFGFIRNENIFIIEYDGIQHFVFTEHWHKEYDKFNFLQQVDKIKTIIPIIMGYNIMRISNDNEENIKYCINMFIYLKSLSQYSNISLIVFDDIEKYRHLIDDCNSDIIIKICNDKYHNEIINKVKILTINVYCIKNNMFYKINVKIDGDCGI